MTLAKINNARDAMTSQFSVLDAVVERMMFSFRHFSSSDIMHLNHKIVQNKKGSRLQSQLRSAGWVRKDQLRLLIAMCDVILSDGMEHRHS